MESLGLTQKACETNIENLTKYLSNLQVLRVKTQGFHWNIIHPTFPMLHAFFEELYESLADKVDAAAERIRMLDGYAPADLSSYADNASIQCADDIHDRETMIASLLSDYETMIKEVRTFANVSSELGDEGTMDFFIEHLRELEKIAWMLKSSRTHK